MKIPLVGIVHVQLPEAKTLKLKANGLGEITSSLFWYGFEAYEPETMQVFLDLLNSSKVVIDVGANVGLYGLVAAFLDAQRQVYAFEPVPQIYQVLRMNAELNQLTNFGCTPQAVSDRDGFAELYIPYAGIPLSASLREGFRSTTETIKVPTITLDSFVQQQEIKKVDLIKIDTESTEHLVLKGAGHLIKRDRPIIICEVLAGYTEQTLQELISPQGYTYFLITSGALIYKNEIKGDKTFKNANYLFIPNEKISNVSLPITE